MLAAKHYDLSMHYNMETDPVCYRCSVPQSIEQAYNSKHHLDRSNMNRITKHQNYIHVCQNNEI